MIPVNGEASDRAGRQHGRGRSWLLLLIPVAFFVLLEAGLRTAGYGGSYPLFVEIPGFEDWQVPNPEVGRRYFVSSSLVPSPPFDPFHRVKPENGFRIVVQGGSSAAGFPYGHGGSFSRMLEQRLALTLPGREVEVINTGMDAVSSYTLLDLVDDIIRVKPDAVLIYAGHNEYYGALGVGSSQSLGRARPIVKLMLSLGRFRTVQALQSLIGRLAAIGAPQSGPASETSTLMEQMARDREIAFGSGLFESGVRQFRENLEDIACRYREAGIPVFVATLVSNERDMPPLVSGLSPATDAALWNSRYAAASTASEFRDLVRMDSLSAAAWYAYARALEREGVPDEAKSAYSEARDRDQLPFRAPSAMNRVVRETADRCGATVVEADASFRALSPGGVPGATLLLEHLHPNVDGHFLIADAFYRALGEAALPEPWQTAVPPNVARGQVLVTELDSTLASLHVRRLLDNWPFQHLGVSRPDTFRVDTEVDRLAVEVLRGTIDWVEATSALGSMREMEGQTPAAIRAALALAQEQPYRAETWALAGRLLAGTGRLAEALPFYARANRLEPTVDTMRMEGQLLTRLGHAGDGIPLLEMARRGDPDHPGVLYDLAVALLTRDRPDEARRVAEHLLEVRPGDPGALRLLERTDPGSP